MKAAIAAAALAATLAGGIGIGVKWTRGEWAQADLERERAAAAQLAAIQKGMDLASAETERRLALAARNLAAARGDAGRVRDLASRVAASDQASERDRERIRVLSELVASGARVVEEGIERVGTLDARLAGCAMTP